MRVLVVEYGKQPYEAEIESTLKAKQEIVGGPIDILEPWKESAVIVLNDEGKNLGLKTNRVIASIEIAGTFFVCNKDCCGNLVSITETQLKTYMQMFSVS